ncbi:MAG: ATP-binding protein, partial [Myxococcales bacterium]
ATTGTTVLARDHAPGAPAAAHTLLAVPIAHGGALLGALALQARDSGIGFSRADVETAEELGRRVAMVAENGRLFREAQAADRRKDEFLAMLGHELRNPLAPIRTALELMNLKGQDTFRHERTIIDRHVRHMVGLVDDLLDVSRITRGTLTLRREPVELSAVLRRSLEMTSPVLERRAHRVVLELPDQPLLLHADEARLVQMISNLLHNAAKYSPPGGEVRITARREGAQVVVAVRDAGIGIAPEMLDRVFELFVQEKRSLDRAEGGLGIGLSIVRSLAEVHGGSVSAHSDGLGCGSEFTLTLPLLLGDAEPAAAPAPLPPPELPAAASADTRLLVVDDNVDAAEVLAEALATLGYGVRVAHDGPQALDAAREFAPRVALVDIGLPVMDGYQVAQRLRATFGKGVRLVALTGYGQDEDRRRSREAGFEQHLVKPIDFNALARLLEELARAA